MLPIHLSLPRQVGVMNAFYANRATIKHFTSLCLTAAPTEQSVVFSHKSLPGVFASARFANDCSEQTQVPLWPFRQPWNTLNCIKKSVLFGPIFCTSVSNSNQSSLATVAFQPVMNLHFPCNSLLTLRVSSHRISPLWTAQLTQAEQLYCPVCWGGWYRATLKASVRNN